MDLSPLCAPTPPGWVAEAVRRWPELLADHANCEKKAASTALALMFAYPEDRALAERAALRRQHRRARPELALLNLERILGLLPVRALLPLLQRTI